MRPRSLVRRLAIIAAIGCPLLAAATGTASATQVTVGSTSGAPTANIFSCAAMIRCTFTTVSPRPPAFNSYSTVPFDGTVTSFSVNSGSAGGTVWLRVLHYYHGVLQGAQTGPPETLRVGVNTFSVSLGVQAGDQIGLDNDSSALVFDTSDYAGPFTVFWKPAIGSGPTAPQSYIQDGYRLLLSATVQSRSTTTPPPPSPTLTSVSQSHRRWRAGSKLATFAAAKKAPIGTTFRFTLNSAATVSFAFSQQVSGRKMNGKCVAQTLANRTRRACTRSASRGSLFFSSTAGPHGLSFQGRVTRKNKLGPGTYTVTIAATNTVGQRATKTLRSFTIVSG